jgi:transcriptional regulator with XRE-family HTH domain
MADVEFGKRLKELREAEGWSQTELAERAGLTKAGIADIEQGRRQPSWGTAVALAKALQLEVKEFLSSGDGVNQEPEILGVMMKLPTMPTGLQAAYTALKSDAVILHANWDLFQFLFMGGAERVSILNRTAPNLFGAFQDALLTSIFLDVSRLTDPAETSGKQNLTLETLVVEITSRAQAQFRNKLRKLLDSLKDQTKAIRIYRNKRLAHMDRATRLNKKAPIAPGVTFADVDASLKGIAKFLNTFSVDFTGILMSYEHSDYSPGPQALLRRLSEAEEYRKLQTAL